MKQKKRLGGMEGMEKYLGIHDKPSVDPQVVAQLEQTQRKLPIDVETIPMRELPAVAEDVIHEIEGENMQSNLPLRELLGLDKSLQSIRGELTNNLAKLGELDKHIEREREKLTEADDPNLDIEIKQRIESRLKDLHIERTARLEALDIKRENLRSQISRIRESINRILNEDTTLAERIKTLFREQGITIASILTAFGFIISTIVLAITGTPGPTPPPPPSKDGSDAKTWIKKQLHHLSELLKKLGLKAVESLPAIIGTIVSWLFSTAGKVVGYMAENLWTLLVLVAGMLIAKIKKN